MKSTSGIYISLSAFLLALATTLAPALLTLSGCVTVNLSNTTYKKATGVKFQEPPAPFIAESRPDVDAAWKNPNNGNLISYLSDCQDPSDPTLDAIVNGVLSGLHDLNIEKNNTTSHQDREAKRVQANGKVEGVASRIDLLVYKRNACIYILSYVGVAPSFEADHEKFNDFVKRFQAP